MQNENTLLTTRIVSGKKEENTQIKSSGQERPPKKGRVSRSTPVKSYDTSKRPHRIPISEQKRVFINEENGYVYRLVNDQKDRIRRMELAGYEKVQADALGEYRTIKDPSQMGTYASQSVGDGITAYYMRIKKEYYVEDQHKKIEATKKAFKNGTDVTQIAPRDKVYGSLTVEVSEKV